MLDDPGSCRSFFSCICKDVHSCIERRAVMRSLGRPCGNLVDVQTLCSATQDSCKVPGSVVGWVVGWLGWKMVENGRCFNRWWFLLGVRG